MNIIQKEQNKSLTFKDLKKGDVFRWHGIKNEVYIKMAYTTSHHNAAKLNGDYGFCEDNDKVESLKGAFVEE